MKKIEKKIGGNFISQVIDESLNDIIESQIVKDTWYDNFIYKEENFGNGSAGLRIPQIGALFAIKAHWSTCNDIATIVMPTGTGKTETMISTIVSEICNKTLIIVPSNLLRKQVAENCLTFGILKELGVIKNEAINPVVANLITTPKSIDELKKILEKSNIIVSTMKLINLFSEEYFSIINDMCSNLIIDEAHHIAAVTWNAVKRKFNKQKILQFTATPFRNDEKKIDGKIIYNFPLALAQKQGYFEALNFNAIFEFDDEKSDLAIAKASVKQLENDIKNGHNHVILVRANTKKRSSELFNNIYLKYFKKFNPVLINSDLKNKDKNERMEKIRKGEAKIVVCVDMFGEGIDIPNLKICAMHDKYKSLPITLQFVGRFARKKKGLGKATVIANIANEEIQEGLKELYAQDSDWNILLENLSNDQINKEISLQDLSSGFSNLGLKNFDIKKLKPKVSMMAYRTKEKDWNWRNWVSEFDEDKSRCCINEEKKVLVIIEQQDSKVEWIENKEINNINWQLHILYWNEEEGMIFVNTTDKLKSSKLITSIFNSVIKIKGEDVFKCLYGVKRLMFGTVGLNSAINGPIRYKMFAGIDIAQGLSESQKQNCIKSNLFGVGYNGNGKVSIGCSYKGTIWSRWVESIDYWIKWCNEVSEKINNKDIDVDLILKGALSPKIISERPKVTPYSIEWPIDLTICNEERIKIITAFDEYPIYEVEILLLNNDIDSPIQFYVGNEEFREEYELVFNSKEGNTYYKLIKGSGARIKYGKNELTFSEFFEEYPPRIKFVDQSTLESNLYIELNSNNVIELESGNIEKWDWLGVDITKESQGYQKESDSVQYKVISRLKNEKKYEIIFDDDNSGEIADVIGIREGEKKIIFEFYHCKFSHDKKIGSRVSDLYELCGQAEKSVSWKQDGKSIIERMIKREKGRMKRGLPSRIEYGNIRKLSEIRNKLLIYDYDIEINIVQPGVDSNKISAPMHEVLCCTKAYLLDTYSLNFKLICS